MSSSPSLLFVGGGQMAQALAGGMIRGGIAEKTIRVVEPDDSTAAIWKERHPEVRRVDIADGVADSDIVIIAVKPPVVPSVAKSIDDWSGKLIVSIAAGVTLERLQNWFGTWRVVQVMPNTPALVGCGVSGYCVGAEASDADRQWVAAALSSVGLAAEVMPSQMSAVTAVSGSGPAYVCLMIEAMADAGVAAGLPRKLSMQLATETVAGAARWIADAPIHPAVGKDAVSSPGGTTIAGVTALEQNGFRAAMMAAVAAASARANAMATDDPS